MRRLTIVAIPTIWMCSSLHAGCYEAQDMNSRLGNDGFKIIASLGIGSGETEWTEYESSTYSPDTDATVKVSGKRRNVLDLYADERGRWVLLQEQTKFTGNLIESQICVRQTGHDFKAR